MMSKKNGKPCKKCGANDWNESGGCVGCMRERSHAHYIANKEEILARTGQYQKVNKDKGRRYKEKYRAANRDKGLSYGREYHAKNKAARAAYAKKYRAENKDRFTKYDREWTKANLDKARAKSHRRRTRLAGGGGSFSEAEFRELCAQYDNRCLKCGRDDVKLTPDHIIPISKGGSSDISNIQPLCGSCNSSKGDRHQDYRTKPGVLRWIQRKLFG